MAITINNKNYDEDKLDQSIKNSIAQIQMLQKRMNELQMDFDNAKVLLQHHQKNIQDNLPASAEIEETKAEKMPKKKKVSKISYETKMSKRKGKVRWLVIERPTGSIIAEEVFEDQAKKIAAFQNKHKQWEAQGGVVQHLTFGKI